MKGNTRILEHGLHGSLSQKVRVGIAFRVQGLVNLAPKVLRCRVLVYLGPK